VKNWRINMLMKINTLENQVINNLLLPKYNFN
jgi:hypothetical protein